MHPSASSRFWELVLFCSLSANIRLLVHPLSCSLVSRVRRGLSECAYGNSFFVYFRASSGFFSCLDPLCVLFTEIGFLGFSCIRLRRFPFLDIVSGRLFWSKQSRAVCCVAFVFSAIVLFSPALAKSCSDLDGCTKTLTFEKALCSRAPPESPLDARK